MLDDIFSIFEVFGEGGVFEISTSFELTKWGVTISKLMYMFRPPNQMVFLS